LAKNSSILSANGKNAKAMLDGKYNTSWTTKGSDSTAVIELNLPKAETFDVLALQENISIGQRIEKFSFEYWDGQTWKEAASGTTVGYKRLLRFEPVNASRVRLRIEQSRLNPTLSEFGLYKQVK